MHTNLSIRCAICILWQIPLHRSLALKGPNMEKMVQNVSNRIMHSYASFVTEQMAVYILCRFSPRPSRWFLGSEAGSDLGL